MHSSTVYAARTVQPAPRCNGLCGVTGVTKEHAPEIVACDTAGTWKTGVIIRIALRPLYRIAMPLLSLSTVEREEFLSC